MSDVKCCKCRLSVNDKSAFCAYIYLVNGSINIELGHSEDLEVGDVVVHVNGDRQCGRLVSGYREFIAEALDLTSDLDMSKIDAA